MQQGWSAKVAAVIREYWSIKDNLSVIDGVIFKGDNIVIPKAFRSDILDEIHTGHLGIVLCKRRARDFIGRR